MIRLRRVFPAACVALALAPVACSSPTDRELRFVDQLRNQYPGMSVSVVGDQELVAAGEAACDGRPAPELERLAALGVDLESVVVVAVDQLCPAR